MIRTIEKMLDNFERGTLSRRQLALSLAALATGAQAASKEPELKAVGINHVTVRVPDLRRTSQFYQEFFGMPLKQQSAKILSWASVTPFLGSSRATVREPRSITTISELPASTPPRRARS
jgi:hypothetical protein